MKFVEDTSHEEAWVSIVVGSTTTDQNPRRRHFPIIFYCSTSVVKILEAYADDTGEKENRHSISIYINNIFSFFTRLNAIYILYSIEGHMAYLILCVKVCMLIKYYLKTIS